MNRYGRREFPAEETANAMALRKKLASVAGAQEGEVNDTE